MEAGQFLPALCRSSGLLAAHSYCDFGAEPKSNDLGGLFKLEGRDTLLRGALNAPRGDTESRWSNKPREPLPRCIHGVLHCSDGAPPLPACSDKELALLCQR